MYAIRTYNHGEFFSNILAPKLIAEVLKWLILCLITELLLVHAIYFPQSTVVISWNVPWLYVRYTYI